MKDLKISQMPKSGITPDTIIPAVQNGKNVAISVSEFVTSEYVGEINTLLDEINGEEI